MSDPVIKVEGVGKKYIIAHEGAQKYTALRDVISGKANDFLTKKKRGSAKEEFWALENVSFEIHKGEATGIIGRNGAGKTTLLKILSRITEPTYGRIVIQGRVASLLEVGTGFHPELTGRENIFLNGAILGMSRSEIKRKFDEIVDFSGVEKFLDTPVKWFSSGMYTRLAFAVAAHLEPEILVVDEVLAVGDAEFQKKCLGKMDEVSKKEGRTVLFVSHNMTAISSICSRGLLLNSGKKYFDGPIDEVIHAYTGLTGNMDSKNAEHIVINEGAVIKKYRFSTEGKEITNGDKILMGQSLEIEIEVGTMYALNGLSLSIDIRNSSGELFSHLINEDGGYKFPELKEGGDMNVKIKTSAVYYVPGYYTIDLWIGNYHSEGYYSIKNALCVYIEQSNQVGRKIPLPGNMKFYLGSVWS